MNINPSDNIIDTKSAADNDSKTYADDADSDDADSKPTSEYIELTTKQSNKIKWIVLGVVIVIVLVAILWIIEWLSSPPSTTVSTCIKTINGVKKSC